MGRLGEQRCYPIADEHKGELKFSWLALVTQPIGSLSGIIENAGEPARRPRLVPRHFLPSSKWASALDLRQTGFSGIVHDWLSGSFDSTAVSRIRTSREGVEHR